MTALAHLDGGSGEIHPAPTTTLAQLDGGSSPASLYTGINKDNQ